MSRKPVIFKEPIFGPILPNFVVPAETVDDLARILRRAAGLDDLPDPTEHNPGEMLWVMHYVFSILSVLPAPSSHAQRPREVARELEALQLDLGEIRRRIKKIDEDTEIWLNRFGSPNYRAHREYHEIVSTDDANHMEELWRAACEEPPETWTVPAVVAALQRLERAIPGVLARANAVADHTPATGKKKNWKAHEIAEIVKEYVRDVTGEPPGPRLRYSGSDFERTLTEIFELLEIKADAQQPAKAALSKLDQSD